MKYQPTHGCHSILVSHMTPHLTTSRLMLSRLMLFLISKKLDFTVYLNLSSPWDREKRWLTLVLSGLNYKSKLWHLKSNSNIENILFVDKCLNKSHSTITDASKFIFSKKRSYKHQEKIGSNLLLSRTVQSRFKNWPKLG